VFPLLSGLAELGKLCAYHVMLLQYNFREIKRFFLPVEENPLRGTDV
jgi:hypothetical protein